jgi:hypothetical protein
MYSLQVVYAGSHVVFIGWTPMGPRGHRCKGRISPWHCMDSGLGANDGRSDPQEN